jgi:hypothetical protein
VQEHERRTGSRRARWREITDVDVAVLDNATTASPDVERGAAYVRGRIFPGLAPSNREERVLAVNRL